MPSNSEGSAFKLSKSATTTFALPLPRGGNPRRPARAGVLGTSRRRTMWRNRFPTTPTASTRSSRTPNRLAPPA